MSEQFVFGPEHVGKRVRYSKGSFGVVESINKDGAPENQLVIKFDDGHKCAFTLDGRFFSNTPILIFLDEPEATAPRKPTLRETVAAVWPRSDRDDPQHIADEDLPDWSNGTDYEETPFIPNRAEVWARFMAASIARENIRNIDEAASFADRALSEYEKRFLNQ